jgi:hypothetical protein
MRMRSRFLKCTSLMCNGLLGVNLCVWAIFFYIGCHRTVCSASVCHTYFLYLRMGATNDT